MARCAGFPEYHFFKECFGMLAVSAASEICRIWLISRTDFMYALYATDI